MRCRCRDKDIDIDLIKDTYACTCVHPDKDADA